MDILIIALIFVVLLAAVFFIPGFLLKRAVRQVIRILRRHNATDPSTAKTDAELGIAPKPFMQRLMSFRDYKPYAVTVMLRAGVIIQTEGGRLYLSEEKLMESNLRKYG